MPDDLVHVDSWLKFAIFMAGSAWIALVGVAAFWAKRAISRNESEKDRASEARKAHSHAAGAHSHSHVTNGRERETDN